MIGKLVSQSLFLLLEFFNLSSDNDKRIWSLETSGVCSFKSYFQLLMKSPSRDNFLN